VDAVGRLSLLLLAFFWLFMASVAVAAVWLVEPARAEGFAVTGHDAANLTITIGNVSPRGGILRLGVYDAAGYPNDKSNPIASADVPVDGAVMKIFLKDLPPGRYAIESFQDVNANGKMDTSWIGLPLEPYGFSHDAKVILSKPGFASVAFSVAPGENSQTMHMQNSQAAATAGF
jgi:uncharacterized protein (DUF2141 family)